jgi:hypothetical protein
MLADVSHQLRTPLAALRPRIDPLAADTRPTAQAELAGVQEEIARLSRLVDGLLATARAESVTEQRVVINLLPNVAERAAAGQPVADGSDVKLVTEPSGDAADGSPGRRSRSAPGTSSRSSTTCSPTRSSRFLRVAGSRSACPRRKAAHSSSSPTTGRGCPRRSAPPCSCGSSPAARTEPAWALPSSTGS